MRTRLASVALGLVFLIPCLAAAGSDGVAPEIWAQIAPQVERAYYEFQPQADAVIAHNRAQDFSLAADPAGLDINGALRLRAVALNGEPLPDAKPVADGRRLEYRRGAVMEWYENRAEGLEQGFTLEQFQFSDFKFQVSLDVAFETELAVRVSPDGQAVELLDGQGEIRYRYAGLKVTDANHQPLGSFFQSTIENPKSHIVHIVCDTSRARFPITIDPVLTGMAKKLLAQGGAMSNQFGFAVAVAGDVAVVGAPQYDDPDPDVGAVYVFERNAAGTNTWQQVKRLEPPEGEGHELFGCAVGVDGDVIVVGMRGDSSYGQDAGSAYVFERNLGGTNNWGQAMKLRASDATASSYFGVSVAVAGDVAVVGASGNNAARGAAYVFERNVPGTNFWGQVKKLTAFDAVSGHNFGGAVAVDGDVIVVGAIGVNVFGAFSGAAYVFERNLDGTNSWKHAQKVLPPFGAEMDFFGCAVAVDGDVVAVGAKGAENGGAEDAGMAHVFERNEGNTNLWVWARMLWAFDADEDDHLGSAVAVAGDVVVVGAEGDSDHGYYSGSAYVFQRNAGGVNKWGQVQKLEASDGMPFDYFGSAVAADNGVILVGAYQDDAPATDSGSAHLFPMQPEDWNETKKLVASNGAADDCFGRSVAVAGDVAIVGAPNVYSEGAAYIYERITGGGTNTWGQVKILPGPPTSSDFGSSVAAAGDVVVVGARNGTGGDYNSGTAYVFERNAGGTNTWGQVAQLAASDGKPVDGFGISVAVAGDVIAVGADGDDNPAEDSGSVYVFERNAGGTNKWALVKKLFPSDDAENDNFGYSVAVAGDVIVAGSKGDDDLGDDSGSAYVFERNARGVNHWGQTRKLLASDGAKGEEFGRSVAVAGDVIAVGSMATNNHGNYVGAVYIFERNAGGTNLWGQVKKLQPLDIQWSWGPSARFGDSLAIAGNVAIVGALGNDDLGGSAGAAYVFSRHEGGTNAWGQVKKLWAGDGAAGDWFGGCMAVDGDVLVIGTMGMGEKAYVFEGALFGPPEITSVRRSAGKSYIDYSCQPAWIYDSQWRASMLTGQWQTLYSLYGSVSGFQIVEHNTSAPNVFYRVLRRAQ